MRMLFMFAASLLALSANAQSIEQGGAPDAGSRHCTLGDVQSTLQAFEVGIFYAGPFPGNIKTAGLGGGVNCQYRFFLPVKPTNGERFTFCEHDVFLGGVVVFYPYKLLGISREYALEDLLQVRSELFFGPADGIQVRQSLLQTGAKGFVHPTLGLTVGYQDAFITQRGPGTYISDWTQYYMDAPVGNVIVEIDVVSHEEHLDRVAAGNWHDWD